MRITRLVFLAVPAVLSAQRADGPVKPADLMRHMNVLAHDSLEGRRVGTPGSAKARTYLVRAFRDAGLEPIGVSFEQAFSFTRDTTRTNGVNIVGVIRGRSSPDRYIVVTAHYDHLGVRQGEVMNGADDNASGAGALVELARQLKANPPQNSVIIAALDAEEGGLRGARAFVASPPVPSARILMNVNLDMVGRNAKNELYAAGAFHYPFLRPMLDSVVTRSALTLKLGHDDPALQRDDWTSQSDHGAFHAAKIPFVYFGVEDHPDYHRASDEIAGIMPAFYAAAVNSVLDAIRVFDANASVIASKSSAR